MPEQMRLQKLLAHAGVASRRAAEDLIVRGKVRVNGKTVRELGTVVSTDDRIDVSGTPVKLASEPAYLLMHKPAGVMTTMRDPQGRRTVADIIPKGVPRVVPVGRLDYDTSGVLLLTNDGELAAALTHPRHGVPRVYEARVAGVPDERDLHRLRKGITIEGRRTLPAVVEVIVPKAPALLRVTIREGRNRQVRKMLEAIGHPVDRLTRVAIGPIKDDRLKPGRWRDLSEAEVRRLRAAVHAAG